MVVWIIGLSGAGKTTLANEVVSHIRSINGNVVMLDGDIMREVFGGDLGHSLQDRYLNASRICRLCKLLDDQGLNVVCSILSLFPESRRWNRQYLKRYYEVFIDTPKQDLVRRDTKKIYSRFFSGEIQDVAGMDIEFQRPNDADLIIDNNGSKEDLLKFTGVIVNKILGVT
jgi:adenylylsulfate kinase-like enzyme